jgi:hypothetical protein
VVLHYAFDAEVAGRVAERLLVTGTVVILLAFNAGVGELVANRRIYWAVLRY